MMTSSADLGLEYFDQQFQLPALKLLPGGFVATGSPRLLVTLLGSCVAACLRDPDSGVCGMNHFLLPASGAILEPTSTSARFGVHAMEMLITEMQRMGARRDRLQAKVFGAGSVLEGMNVVNVGELNAAFVRQYLEVEGIPLLASDLLGESARKVYFFTDTGKVMIRRLKPERIEKVVVEEERYLENLKKDADRSGSIDLFS